MKLVHTFNGETDSRKKCRSNLVNIDNTKIALKNGKWIDIYVHL